VKIAVNTRLLLKDRLEGIGQFTANIFEILSREHPEVEWIFLFDRPWHPDFIFDPGIEAKVLFPPTRHPLLWQWWFQWSVPRYLNKIKADLFISPDGMIPLWGNCPSISVIHDLNYEHQPDNLDKVAGGFMRHYYPKFAHHAKRVATVSEYCKKDIADTYSVSPAKIDVVPNGYGPHFKALSEEAKIKVRTIYSEGSPYFLYLGALNPRKNLEGLMGAFALYRSNGGENKLLITGEKMRWTPAIEQAYQSNPFKEDILFTGRLADADLAEVLASAEALCLVSHFEGFGIPIIEAFACETAVICANNTAMPEITGEAALLVDSRNTESIAKAMQQMEKVDLQSELIQKGKVQLQKFSWQKAAEAMWDSIQKSLN